MYDDNKPLSVNNVDIHPDVNTPQLQLFKSLLLIASIKDKRIVLASGDLRGPACYVKVDTVPYIIYNPAFFNNKPEYLILGVMSHELGHYINHHDDIGSRSDLEIDADYYTGFFLKRLGVPDLNKAYSCLDLIQSDEATATHPAKLERKISIENGWKNAEGNGLSASAGYSPRIIWRENKGTVTILINGDSIKQRLLYRNGLIYIEKMNTTLQLHGLTEGSAKGTGRIINNKTNVTYIRTTASKYKLFRKGKIVTLAESDPGKWEGDNYIITLHDPDLKRRVQYVLEDYAFARNGLFMPGFAR